MKINRNNYEAFFIDYIDGNLAPEMEQELRIFLHENPDLEEELEDVKSSMDFEQSISGSLPVFGDKEGLKKQPLPVTGEELTSLLVGEVENALSTTELALLDRLCEKYPFVKKDRSLFAKTILNAAPISYDHKKTLLIPDAVQTGEDEMYIIAALEGDLTEGDRERFDQRLNADLDFAQLMRLLSASRLSAANVSSGLKDKLLFPSAVDLSDPTNQLVAKLEGDLSQSENKKLNLAIQNNAALRNEFRLIQSTKLPAVDVPFEFKDSLRRKETLIIPFRKIALNFVAAAAVVVLIFMVVKNDPVNPARIASTQEVEPHYQPRVATADARSSSGHLKELQEKNSSGASYQKPGAYTGPKKSLDSGTSLSVIELTPSPAAERIKSIDSEGLAMADDRNLMHPAPNMQLIHGAPAVTPETFDEPQTVLAYLGKKASKKIESTYAYSFAEKQYERISERTRTGLALEKKEEESKDEIYIKIGSFELRRHVNKSNGESANFIERAEKLYRKVAGE